jgi:hypothetical protein
VRVGSALAVAMVALIALTRDANGFRPLDQSLRISCWLERISRSNGRQHRTAAKDEPSPCWPES